MNKKPGYEELEQRIRELEKEVVKCKQKADAFKEEGQQLISLFDNIDEIVYVADPETYELLYVNAPVKAIFGKDIIGRKCYKVFQSLDGPCDFCTNPVIFKKGFDKAHIWEFQNRIDKRWYRCIDKAIKWPDGRMVRYEMAIDIHDRKRSEEALKESEKRFSTFMDHLPGSAFMKDEQSQYIYVNKYLLDTFGKKEWLNRPMYELFPEGLAGDFVSGDKKTMEKGVQVFTNTMTDKNGVKHVYRTYKFPIFREGKPVIIGGMGIDITDQVKAEEALSTRLRYEKGLARCSRELLEETENALPEAIRHLLEAAESDRVYVFENFLDDVDGLCARQIDEVCAPGVKPEIDNPVLQHLSYKDGGNVSEWQKSLSRGDQVKGVIDDFPATVRSFMESQDILSTLIIPIFIKGKWYGFIGFDETRRKREWIDEDVMLLQTAAEMIGTYLERKQAEENTKRLESRLRQAQKMEAIGTLAGGIAHDFNNVLYPIFGYTEMTMDEVAEKSIARKNLEGVLKAAKRARDLVQQILTFSRQSEQERRPIKIQPLIKEALKLLRSSLPTTIEINQYLDRECGAIMADSTQIHQIVMNLCTNAYHAMREKGGVLEVGIRNVEFGMGSVDKKDKEERSSIEYPVLKTGKYLELTVSDTGHGMSRDVMSRIFDPYFTTKAAGDGTGMGLAVTYGIVKSHGGDIRVYSKEGEGTTFHVYLPVVERDVVKPKTGHTGIIQRGDEQQIVEVTRQMLERSGYHVTPRTSSVEALEAFRAQPGKFDLVITDMTMPNMTGSELAASLLEIRPDIPIILCTGFSEVVSEEKAKEIGIREYVMKPIIWSEITSAIRRVLDT